MTPESALFLHKAREFVLKAQEALARWPDEAGRASYLAAFHAAQAFIFEQTGNVLKSHSGLRGRFGQLIKDDPRFDVDLRSFLGRAANLKAIADYETGPGSEISPERAARAVQTAGRFVEFIAGLLPANGMAPPSAPEDQP